MNKKIRSISIILFCFYVGQSWAINQDDSFPVVDGVTFRHWQSDSTGTLHNINILKVDYTRKDLEILSVTATPSAPTTGRKRTSEICHEWNAIAGINGGYFKFFPPMPVGLVVHHGKIIIPSVKSKLPRGAIGFTKTHRVVIDLVEVKEGKIVGLNGTDWSDVSEAMGGGPILVRDGETTVSWTEEVTVGSWKEESMGLSFSTTAHPRTAIGVTKDTTVILVVVDGRQPKVSIGMSLNDLAQLMIQLGCMDAINLDGGGSSTMVVQDKVVNHVSDDTDELNRAAGVERAVTDAIIIKKKK